MSESVVDRALHEGFATANPEFSPVPIWWWSGDELELERMLWQIDQLVAQGVYNVVILNLAPTGPMHGALSDAPHMLTDDWWGIWDAICVHAQKVGMRFWFYDQIGFSGANLQGRLAIENPAYVGMELHRVSEDFTGSGTVALPNAGVFLSAQAVPLDDAGNPSGAAIALECTDGVASWSGEGRARVMIAYAIRKGFDYHSKDACGALIDIVHHNFERHLKKYFGTAIVGSFQDELPSMPTWSEHFATAFEAQCGYSILPVIAALWEDWGLESARVRIDYQRVRSALSEEALFKPIFDWHESHGLVFGVDQQSPSRAAQPISTVDQYADYARTHRWYSAPGSDHWGDAKFHSSIAHSYGRPRTWIEAFHSSGWGGTLEETYDWLQPWLLAGANLYDPHAVYYSTKGGQWEWAAPSTCWRQPYWRHYKYFADAISRLCWASTRGEHVCDVGVLFPSATVQSDFLLSRYGRYAAKAHDSYQALIGQMTWFNSRAGIMKRLRRDYDVLDDDTIAGAAIEGKRLKTRGEYYKALIVPDCWMLETATAEKLVAFAEAGGRLIFIGQPPAVADRTAGDAAIARLAELATSGTARVVSATDSFPGLQVALDDLPAGVTTDSPTLLRKIGDTNLLLVTAASAGAATAEGRLPWAEWSYDSDHFSWPRYNRELRDKGIGFDLSAQRDTAVVRIAGAIGAVEQWDPATGKAVPVNQRKTANGVAVTLDFALSPITVLVWSDKGEAITQAAPTAPSGHALALPSLWTSEIVPTIDNRHGDFTLPASEGPLPVQAWQIAYREGDATAPDASWTDWERVPVTDGIRGWSIGPFAAGALPPVLPADHAGALDAAGWSPIRYSLSRGIDHDPQHDKTLGPKSRVLEPLFRLTKVAAGDMAQLRVALPVEQAGRYTLAIGGNGRKQVWWNGVEQEADPGGYLHMIDVDAKAGSNILELRLTADETAALEAYWALTTDRDAFVRPEWVMPADGWHAGTILTMRRTVNLAAGDGFDVHLGSIGAVTLVFNGHEIGMQGAFEPYAQWRNPRVLRYDLTPYMQPGDNTLEVRFTDDGGSSALFVDGLVTEAATGAQRSVVSNLDWTAIRNNAAVPLTLTATQRNDSRFFLLRARPHPLPRSGWLAPDQPLAGVLDIVPEPYPGADKPAQWFSLPVPPGAVRVTLPIEHAEITAFLDQENIAVGQGSVDLPHADRAERTLLLRVVVKDGRRGGAVWEGPLEFETGRGRIELGSWITSGLEFYSGGVAYEQTIAIADPGQWSVLDLGRVRGTAEVEVNGRPIGARVWSPYRFDLSGALHAGSNTIVVRVFNTLAPYLKGASPTRTIFGEQDDSGLFGPVILR